MFVVVNGREAEAHLRGIVLNIENLAPAFDTVGGRFRSQVEAQFALGGAIPGSGGAWRALSPFTRSHKAGNRILIDKSKLLDSYTNKNAKYNINEIRPNRARFGSGFKRVNASNKLVPIAKFHQESTIYMRARPVLFGQRRN